jgi:hypothetical protein
MSTGGATTATGGATTATGGATTATGGATTATGGSGSDAGPGAPTWRNVVIGGGGWITGLFIDPGSGALFARGDVGTLYRRDAGKWTPLLDWVDYPNKNEYGVESVALSPTYAKDHTLYAAVGTYGFDSPYDILVSTDGGDTLTSAGTGAPRMGANDDGRWCGERLAIDPHHQNAVYFGARNYENGAHAFYKLTSGKWALSTSNLPGGTEGQGISFVAVDPQHDSGIFAGVVDETGTSGGVWQSTDGGATWAHLTGNSRKSPCRAVFDSQGTLYVDYRSEGNGTIAGGVAKVAAGATQLTDLGNPSGHSDAGYYALAVDPTTPGTAYVTQSEGAAHEGQVMYVTRNGGTTWTLLQHATPQAADMAVTQSIYTWFAGPASMIVNPANHDEAWVSDGFGVLHTTDLTAAEPSFSSFVTGIEQIVPEALGSVKNSSVALLSGAADVGGFVHASLDASPSGRLMEPAPYPEALGFAYCRKDPSVVAFAGRYYDSQVNPNVSFAPMIGRSNDGGATFTMRAGDPLGVNPTDRSKGGGRIAISPANCDVWVLQTCDGSVFQSADGGNTWKAATNAPSVPTVIVTSWTASDLTDQIHNNSIFIQQLTVDAGGTFYIAALSGGGVTISSSADGASWTKGATTTLPKTVDARHYTLRANPEKSGELWLAVRGAGVLRSTDGGATFAAVGTLTTSGLLAFGAPKSASAHPSVFVHTTAGEFERSDDLGGTWDVMTRPAGEKVGDDPDLLEADQNVWGQVFVGTQGRGIFVGTSQ